MKRKLSDKEEYSENITYSITNDEWLGGYAFSEEEKQEIIQAILNYNPSADEVKKTPPIKMTPAEQNELARCREYDAKMDGDSYLLGY